MSSPDADRVVGRTSPFPRQSGAQSPSPSASLTDQHLAEALANSPDNGATLDFTHKGLTDVGEDGAERLATSNRSEYSTDDIAITRSVLLPQHTHAPTEPALESHLVTIVLRLFQPHSHSCHAYVI